MKTKEYWVNQLSLEAHPEGGYFKETYRSPHEIDANTIHSNLEGERNLSTGIYFLIDSGNFSAFHRIQSDEMWHYYAGDALVVHMINLEGKYLKQEIGPNLEEGQVLQFVVPAHYWFASEVKKGGDYALVGCTVSFGFDFRDFELATHQLIKEYPQHEEHLKRLIRA